jgi:uncharacterized repeat protein (TIGR01451 family)
MFLVAFAILFAAGELWAAPHKVRVKDPELARELMTRGGKLIADYGSFQWIETPEPVAPDARRERAQLEDGTDTVELNSVRIHTRSPEGQALRKLSGGFAGRRLHLIQFAGPIKPEWRESVEQLGLKIVNYVPHNAYVIYGDATALARLQAWANTTNVVQWDGEFTDDFKLQPGARSRDEFGQRQELGTDTFAIQLLGDDEANAGTLALIESLKLAPVKRDFRVLQYRNLIVRLPADRLPEIAAQPEVVSIQPYTDPDKRDERQAQIIAGNIVGTSLTGPGYLEWLLGKGFTQEQFEASNFAVDVTDSGIDNGTLMPGHFGLYAQGDPARASRVIYNRLEGAPNVGSATAGLDGHGNLNAHILAGYNAGGGGFPHADAAGFRYGLGICPFVKIGASVVFDPDFFTNPDYADLQSKAYASGARISANSWGMTNNAYTMESQAYDALVRDAQPFGSAYAAPGNQEMVIVFAAGNRGATAHTVGAPGTAKNVITVGASENVRSLSLADGGKNSFGNDGCGYGDGNADAANDLATFSSRGPCSDGRQKPDLVAPGTHITGGVPQLSPLPTGWGAALEGFKASSVCALSGGGWANSTNNFFPLGQQYYTVSSGTSHSTPAVAGACALLRQYFINASLPAPSPAMTKAFLMNSTRFLTGSGANDSLWSPGQGMGALNIGRAFDGVPRLLRDQVEQDTFTASGQTRMFTGRISETNQPLRVTLAWTDAPGSTMGNAFNNDLDLTVTVGGNTYKGNRFSETSSVTGGNADAKNNVESVFLPAGVSGNVIVTVTAANINSDGVPNYGTSLDQDFALVVYNAIETTLPIISTPGLAVVAEGFFPTNGVADPGEMVTVNLTLQNNGTQTASNLLVTLLATNGVASPSGAQSFGNLLVGGAPVSRGFTFVANGIGGVAIHPVVQLQDASGSLGSLTLKLPLGVTTVETFHFTNATPIVIPDSGKASVYPSLLIVSEIPGTVQKVTATLRGFSHSWPDDVDALLVGPAGQNVLLLSDCGGGSARNGITLNFNDVAPAFVPDSAAIAPETYKPSNVDTTTDNFPAPAPAGSFGGTLASFQGSNPNGNWLLYIQDDGAMDSGSLTQGWVLSITTSNVTCAEGIGNSADLEIAAMVSAAPVLAGSNFTLTITVTNHGPNPAAFVMVTNTLPMALAFNSAMASQGNYSRIGNKLTWSAGILPPGMTANITIEAKALLAGLYLTSSQVGSVTADPNWTDNAESISVQVLSAGSGLTVATNVAPTLASIPNRTIHAGSLLVISNSATDADSLSNSLTFSLLSGTPPTSSINPETGLFTWPTTDADADSTNQISVQVADDGLPALTDTKSFQVTVVSRPLITNLTVTNGVVQVTWAAVSGETYRLQCATNLIDDSWSAISADLLATGPVLTDTNAMGSFSQQFYRVLVVP